MYLSSNLLLTGRLSNSDRGNYWAAAGVLFDTTDAEGELSDNNAALSAEPVCRPFSFLRDNETLTDNEGTC